MCENEVNCERDTTKGLLCSYLWDGEDVDGLGRWGFQVSVLSRFSGHPIFQETQAERVSRLGAPRFDRASELVRIRIIRVLVQELLVAITESATDGIKVGIPASGQKIALGCWVPGITRLVGMSEVAYVRSW